MKGSEHEPFERRIMKKKFIPLVIAVATLMASCNHPSSPTTSSSIGTGTSQVAKYTVTANSSEDFEVTGLEKDGYAEGATVTFRINVKNALKEVERVIVDKKALTPAEDGTYSFTMGTANVVINITLKDKEGVKTVSLELSNNNPGTGDVVAVTMKLDGVAVTEGVTLEATKGADLVEIAGNLVTCKAVGEVTIKAAATVDGIPYSKETSWTIVEGVTITDIATIQTIKPAFDAQGPETAETEYTVEGRVVALYKYGCIIKDATGYMQINDTKKGANTVTVGEYIRVTGKPECYKSKATDIRWWVMTENNHAEYALQKVANPAKTVDMPVARTDFTQADLDNYSKNEVRGQAIYLDIKMTAVTNGKFTNLYVGDAKTGVEDMSESGKIVTITGGHAYQVKGFLMENSDGHVKLYATEAAQLPDAVESVAVTGTETMIIGATQQLTAAITPATAPQDVVWSSNAEGVATVSETGLVTAVAAGKATITATAKDTSIVGSIEITVTAAAVAATGITLDATTAEIKLGGTKTLVATVTPADSTDTVTWETSDANVATVEGGIVTAVAVGTATITAKVGEFSAACTVTVLNPYGTAEAPLTIAEAKALCDAAGKDKLVSSKITVKGVVSSSSKGQYGYTIWLRSDDGATAEAFELYNVNLDASITENYSAPNALVGKTIVATGWATLYKSTYEISNKNPEGEYDYGVVLSVAETPKVAATGISLDFTKASVEVGKTKILTATVIPFNYEGTITWETSDANVATVADGVVTGVAVGTATVTAKIGEFTATCTVTVTAPVVGALTASVNITAYAKAQGYKNQDQVKSVKVGDHVTATVTATDANSGKIYLGNSFSEWRMYASGKAVVTLTADTGYTINSASLVYGKTKKGYADTTNNGDFKVVNGVATFSTADAGDSNFQIRSIEVNYVAVAA